MNLLKCFWCGVATLSLLLTTVQGSEKVAKKIAHRLNKTLDYLLGNIDKINIDCLLGVVLSDALLQDADPSFDVGALRAKHRRITDLATPQMESSPNWFFLKYLVSPEVWQKHIRWKFDEFRMAYAMRSKVENLFSVKAYDKWSETFTDNCIFLVVNETSNLTSPRPCHLDSKCERFIEDMEEGVGYVLTHKLLLLQVSRLRKCKMNPKILAASIKKVCFAIYSELVSLDFYWGLDDVFDLFLEQAVLCGYEGFADFLSSRWLKYILQSQDPSGCFRVNYTDGDRKKRESREYKDGCIDHTTGLGAAVLSLYLNYYTNTLD